MLEHQPSFHDDPDIEMPTPTSDVDPCSELDVQTFLETHFEPPLTPIEEEELSVIFVDPYAEAVYEAGMGYDDIYDIDDDFEIDNDDGQDYGDPVAAEAIDASAIYRTAFRGEPVETWERPESADIITERICKLLSCDLDARVIRFAQQEAARQRDVFGAYAHHDILYSDYMNYRARMGRVAVNLVKLFGQPKSEDEQTDMIDAVLVALKPIDDQIQALSKRLPKF